MLHLRLDLDLLVDDLPHGPQEDVYHDQLPALVDTQLG